MGVGREAVKRVRLHSCHRHAKRPVCAHPPHTVPPSLSHPTPEVMSFEDERELLLRWRDLVLEADPDIIIGGGGAGGADSECWFCRSVVCQG